jgi:ParB-like nuclease domain
MQAKTKPRSRLGDRENKSMPNFDLTVVYRRIEALKPDPANPRLHSKKQIRQIAHSIETFGFNVPVLVDVELKVIAGHGRLLACGELGWTEVPTLCLDHPDPSPGPRLHDRRQPADRDRPAGTTNCWHNNSRTSRCSGSISASR